MVSLRGTETSPSSGASSPTIRRKSVVLPAPLGPTRPTFSPGFSWKEASMNRTCRPYCLPRREKEIKPRSVPGHVVRQLVHVGVRVRPREVLGEGPAGLADALHDALREVAGGEVGLHRGGDPLPEVGAAAVVDALVADHGEGLALRRDEDEHAVPEL